MSAALENICTRPPATWAAWICRIHAPGGASGSITMEVIFVVCLCCCGWTQHHGLIVCKKWYKNNFKMRLTALLGDPPMHAPYLKLPFLPLLLAACRPHPPSAMFEEDDRTHVAGVNMVVEACEGWSSTTQSCLPLEQPTPLIWTQKPVQSWAFCGGLSSPDASHRLLVLVAAAAILCSNCKEQLLRFHAGEALPESSQW